MSNSLEMSLDEIICKNQTSGGHDSHFRGKGTGSWPERRVPRRRLTRTAPYSVRQNIMQPVKMTKEAMTRQQSMITSGIVAETEKRIYISNLDYGVSDEDIQLVFSDVGKLKSYGIHYDRSGRSKGTAEVVYFRHMDALEGIKRFNNALLDGKRLKIELVGEQLVAADPVPPTTNGILENPNIGFRSAKDTEGAKDWVRSGRGSGRGRWQGNLNGDKLAAYLDAELDEYLAQARRTI